MKSIASKAFLASVLGIAVLTGCGGGGSEPVAQTELATSVPADGVVKFVADLQATATSDSVEPRNINLVDLGVEDSTEPGAV